MGTVTQSAGGARAGGGRAAAWRVHAWLRRFVILVLALTQTAVGTYYMLTVLPYHGDTLLEKCLATVFALLFGWIASGFWVAVFGFVLRRGRGDRQSLLRRHPPQVLAATPLAPTAIVMPLYHEPVARSLAGLRAIYESLRAAGRLEHFEFFILSDSRDPEVWLEEQAGWAQLCRELGAAGRIHYRRRRVHLRHKSGNVADFLRRWGADFEYFMVLDADSLVSGDALVRMVQLMQREPQVGIVQTNPAIINARSAFARLQQFAGRAYGGIFAAGLAGLQLGDATYWGHNALIRTAPFMRHCGLRSLPAFGLFRGPILSHDFVEAAYMRRAGYEVWLEPELGGSYEEHPPSLSDELTRDRRWTKGNMQHLWLLLRAPRLAFAHRLVFVNGIMSYLASPLWLLFLLLAAAEVTRFTLWPIDYFPDQPSLFPQWPEWNPDWAMWLAASTLAVLFLPKLLAVADLLLAGRARAYGGAGRLALSAVTELCASVLLAPIRMLAHTRFVFEAVFNVSLRWAGQNRSEETQWGEALRHYAPATLVAAGWAGFAYWLNPVYFYWSLPVTLSLVLAAPTSVLLSRARLGIRLRRHRLLLVPEEIAPPDIVRALAAYDIAAPSAMSPFEEAVIDPRLNALHAGLARSGAGRRRAELAGLQQRCIEQGPRALSATERAQLADDRDALRALHAAAWRAPADSYWGRVIDGHRRRPLTPPPAPPAAVVAAPEAALA